ncbi:hypothetical protein RJ641_019107 [Dillenia turbinata]|uniref:Uncharacterized protein n=1 Tax=Dillenia turbinata TaxID=194707 RepID=A0AAN8YX32_9MAGN
MRIRGFAHFRMESPVVGGEEKGLVERRKRVDDALPVLTPFQLAGPMEIWIQDAKDMRISLPIEIMALILDICKILDSLEQPILNVSCGHGKGARSVSLHHPLNLPLPLNRTNSGFCIRASNPGGSASAIHLRPQGAALLSLRVVGPTSLTSPSPSSSSSNRLSLGALLLALWSYLHLKTNTLDSYSAIDVQADAPSLLTPEWIHHDVASGFHQWLKS